MIPMIRMMAPKRENDSMKFRLYIMVKAGIRSSPDSKPVLKFQQSFRSGIGWANHYSVAIATIWNTEATTPKKMIPYRNTPRPDAAPDLVSSVTNMPPIQAKQAYSYQIG